MTVPGRTGGGMAWTGKSAQQVVCPVLKGCPRGAASHVVRSAWHSASPGQLASVPPASAAASALVLASMNPWIAAWSPTLGHAPPAAMAFVSSPGHVEAYWARHFCSAVARAAPSAVVANFASAFSRQAAYLPAALFLALWHLCAGVVAAPVVPARSRTSTTKLAMALMAPDLLRVSWRTHGRPPPDRVFRVPSGDGRGALVSSMPRVYPSARRGSVKNP